MRLLSYMHQGVESYGAAIGDNAVNLSRAFPQYPTLAEYIGSGAYLQAAEHARTQPVDGPLATLHFQIGRAHV